MLCLFSNRSQITSKCGENKIVAREAIAECVSGWNLLDGGNLLKGAGEPFGGRRVGGTHARTHERTNERMNEWNLSNMQKSQHVPSKVALSHLVSLRAVTHSNSEQV